LNDSSWNWLKEKCIQDLEGESEAAAMFMQGRLVFLFFNLKELNIENSTNQNDL